MQTPRYYWYLPLLAFLAITPFLTQWDLSIARSYFDPKHGFSETPFQYFLYAHGVLPGFALSAAGAAIFFCSFIYKPFKPMRRGALVACLTFALGAGVIVNGLFKEFWGRPRPRQVVEFGGNYEFRPYYLPDFTKKEGARKSFPSGHASNGFSFICLYFIGRHYRRNYLKAAGVILTIAMGLLLSWARIAVGGHFLSDTIASALLMWYSALILNKWILEDERRNETAERDS